MFERKGKKEKKEVKETKEERNEAFIQAAKKGEVEKVKQLLNAGADINYQIRAFSSIMVGGGNMSLGMESVSRQSPTALLHALNHGHKEVVAVLVEQGADCNLAGGGYFGEVVSNSCTPLQCAIYNRKKCDKATVQLLIKGGANIYGSANLLKEAAHHKADTVLECITEKLKIDGVSEEQYHNDKFRMRKQAEMVLQLKSSSIASKNVFFESSPADTEKKVTSQTLMNN